MRVYYYLGRAKIEDVKIHLQCCDDQFIPRLSSRLEIIKYATKIVENANTFEAWIDDELVGLIATYCNSPDRKVAHITSVSVLQKWHNKGIAKQLLVNCIDAVNGLGFKSMHLEVDTSNEKAISFYTKHGFSTFSHEENIQKMSVNFKMEL
jgi:ribosomal-protein-alanine N-acetyltransferase